MPTGKLFSIPIGLAFLWVDMQTLVASLASVSRVHQHYTNSFLQGFIGNKCPQLIKRPTIRPPTLCLMAWLLVDAFLYPRQVFQGNPATSGFCSRNNSFGDAMIHPCLKASLLARQPLQQSSASGSRTACALTGFFLEYHPQLGVVVSYFG